MYHDDPDAEEFGKDSDTYKIIDDCAKRYNNTDSATEKENYHKVAEQAREMYRAGTPYKYGQDEIMKTLHKNAEMGRLYSALYVPAKLATVTNPAVMPLVSSPYVWYVTMTCTKWDYKEDEEWQVPYGKFDGLLIKNPYTMDKDDGVYVQYGIDMANQGR